MDGNAFDLVVVGSGLSGMTAAASAAAGGARVALTSTGFGNFVFGAGCVEKGKIAISTTKKELAEAFAFFRTFAEEAGCPYAGGPEESLDLPTMFGTFQEVAMAPAFLAGAAASRGGRATIVGVKGLSSFDVGFIAERLTAEARKRGWSVTYDAWQIGLAAVPGTTPTLLQFANRFDRDEAFRDELLAALKPVARETDLIILPGILGMRSRHERIESFAAGLGCRIAELPTLPPSIVGLRLHYALEERLRQAGVEFFNGYPVSGLAIADGRCRAVSVATPARERTLAAEAFILASGQFSDHLLQGGLAGVDRQLRPLGTDGKPLAENLHAVGALLPAAASGGRRGGNELAIVTGYRIGRTAVAAKERA